MAGRQVEGEAALRARAREVARRLARAIPEPRCELRFESPWQLLVATILSAQSTDRRVNAVTPELFARFPDPASLGSARPAEVERLIRSTGFFRTKARNIREASRLLAERHGGVVPRSVEDLVRLPGVARKTANLVLGTAYGLATGIVVDTHVARVATRLELSRARDPERIERDLMALLPRRCWVEMGHRLLLHGRYVCQARSPACAACPLNEVCPAAAGPAEGRWTSRADGEAERIRQALGDPPAPSTRRRRR